MQENGLGVDGGSRFYHPDSQLVQAHGDAEVQGRVAARSLKKEPARFPELLHHLVALQDGVEFLLHFTGGHDIQRPGVIQEAEREGQQTFVRLPEFLFFLFCKSDRSLLRVCQRNCHEGRHGREQNRTCHLSHAILIREGAPSVTPIRGLRPPEVGVFHGQ